MKKLLLMISLLILAVTYAFAATGTLHLIYANGANVIEADSSIYYEFDIQAWLSEGNEVLGAGMAYVEYPEEVFGTTVVMNNKVTATKIGILDGVDPELLIELYDIINTNDTKITCFAVTFEATYLGFPETYNAFYSDISTDSLSPSDLLHIRIETTSTGSGNVYFPSYIPGTEYLYFNLQAETFAGGLDYSEAIEAVYIESEDPGPDPDPDPDPVFTGSVELKSFTASWKRENILIKWSTKDEIDIAGYNLKRALNDGEYVEIVGYLTDPSLVAKGGIGVIKYEYADADVIPGAPYSYQLECVDDSGGVLLFDSIMVAEDEDYIVESSYPNPFNPSFVVPFELHTTQDIDIKLYNISGKVVRDIASGSYQAGRYRFTVHCNDLSSGIYLLKTIVNRHKLTQKMLLVK
ncbi:MAG: T9SS type A sorting domain-containing protein [Candidatus Marinimicrobia bacterium]|nr:T9SS type A sorting domain-containing protein [Candidatus Neomarinimicrobiota bacterium]